MPQPTRDTAQFADGDVHHRIADGRFGPHGIEQCVFGHQAIGMRHQGVQHLEGFRRRG